MITKTPVSIFFNFRSPYCYLASKRMFDLLARYDVDIDWRPLGGWDGRSPPERAKVKIPLVRQDVARFCRRMAIPFNPPPSNADDTAAARGSLYAESKRKLQAFVTEVMHAEWGEGNDIGQTNVLVEVAGRVGLEIGPFSAALSDKASADRLTANWEYAVRKGVLGVPTFVVGDAIFWGNDRLEFVEDHLNELRLGRR